jgi:hypothetical protein
MLYFIHKKNGRMGGKIRIDEKVVFLLIFSTEMSKTEMRWRFNWRIKWDPFQGDFRGHRIDEMEEHRQEGGG